MIPVDAGFPPEEHWMYKSVMSSMFTEQVHLESLIIMYKLEIEHKFLKKHFCIIALSKFIYVLNFYIRAYNYLPFANVSIEWTITF